MTNAYTNILTNMPLWHTLCMAFNKTFLLQHQQFVVFICNPHRLLYENSCDDLWLVGGGNLPLEKYEFVNWDDEITNIWEN